MPTTTAGKVSRPLKNSVLDKANLKGKTAGPSPRQKAAAAGPQVNPQLSEYNGNPMIILNPEKEKFAFQFGLGKARLIVAAMEEIQAFVASEGKSID